MHIKALEKQRTKNRVLTALNQLPADLDDTYQAALDRIANDEIGMRVLKWVTCAKRNLKAAELQHALAASTTGDIYEDDLIDVVDLVSQCAGLVTFEPETGIFRLVHYTAQIFLQDRLQGEGNAEIAKTCLRYFLFPAFSKGDLVGTDYLLEWYKLRAYAAKHCFQHVHAASETDFDSQILDTFKMEVTRIAVFRLMKNIDDNLAPRITILQWASMCGLPSVCCKILDYGSPDIPLYSYGLLLTPNS